MNNLTRIDSLKARRELIQSIAQRYHAANKTDKNRILDELVAATGYHRVLQRERLNTRCDSLQRPGVIRRGCGREVLMVLGLDTPHA